MTFRFLSPVISEIAGAAEYYDQKVAGLGADFIDEVDSAIERILSFPEAWGRISKLYRHCNLRRFPYTIIYSTQDHDEVLIVSVISSQSRSVILETKPMTSPNKGRQARCHSALSFSTVLRLKWART